jgi:hypothetical protein
MASGKCVTLMLWPLSFCWFLLPMQGGVTPCQISSLPHNKTLALALDSKDAAKLVSSDHLQAAGVRVEGCVCVCVGGCFMTRHWRWTAETQLGWGVLLSCKLQVSR